MKAKKYERESVLGNIIVGFIMIAVIFAVTVIFTANPGEIVQQKMEEKMEEKDTRQKNEEISALIQSGEMDAAISMAVVTACDLTEENAEAIQRYQEMIFQEALLIEEELGKVRDTYLQGDAQQAEELLYSLCKTYPESEYVKAYLELFNSTVKELTEEDMYDWKQLGKPVYGTYKDYMGNHVTGFCFRSNDIDDGQYGYFHAQSYERVVIEAVSIRLVSETLPITVTDLNTNKQYTVYCPRAGVCESVEITGGDIMISVPEGGNDAYGSAAVRIILEKELTEADFNYVDIIYKTAEEESL